MEHAAAAMQHSTGRIALREHALQELKRGCVMEHQIFALSAMQANIRIQREARQLAQLVPQVVLQLSMKVPESARIAPWGVSL
mmetsp:Transcript_121843/g.316277  ORF Transcript_121843/g.316277 Transcript_121843/m.316277 type:complete len:83 (-) Transcript_121843:1736-1984(-)